MRHLLLVLSIVGLFARPASGQTAPAADLLLDRLVGSWVLRGPIAGRNMTHDISAEWMLGHEYLRLHEQSRERDEQGRALYEAVVLIGRDAAAGEYQCLWLDSTGGGGLDAKFIARAKPSGDTIPFVFREPDGSVSFTNTFAYEPEADAWTWALDNVREGKPTPFARVRLTRP